MVGILGERGNEALRELRDELVELWNPLSVSHPLTSGAFASDLLFPTLFAVYDPLDLAARQGPPGPGHQAQAP